MMRRGATAGFGVVGEVGEFGYERDGQIVYRVEAEVFERFESGQLPEPLMPVIMTKSAAASGCLGSQMRGQVLASHELSSRLWKSLGFN